MMMETVFLMSMTTVTLFPILFKKISKKMESVIFVMVMTMAMELMTPQMIAHKEPKIGPLKHKLTKTEMAVKMKILMKI